MERFDNDSAVSPEENLDTSDVEKEEVIESIKLTKAEIFNQEGQMVLIKHFSNGRHEVAPINGSVDGKERISAEIVRDGNQSTLLEKFADGTYSSEPVRSEKHIQ